MYFDKINSNELGLFHNTVMVDKVFYLSNFINYCNVEEITEDIKRIVPLFYANSFTSTNEIDRVLDNKCLLTQNLDDTQIRCGGDSVFNRTYITPYRIGDKLSESEFNKIVYLLKNTLSGVEFPVIISKDTSNDYFDLTYTIENPLFSDRGLIITENSNYSVQIDKKLFKLCDFTLKVEYMEHNQLNIDTIEEYEVVTEYIDLTDGEPYDLTTLGLDNTILYDATVTVDVNGQELKVIEQYLYSITLSSDKTSMSPNETATLSATVLDENDTAVEGATVTFYNGDSVISTSTTNSSGIATATVSSSIATTLTVSASVYGISSNSIVITVTDFDGITLTGSKSILSYVDRDNCVLSAQLTVDDEPIAVEGVTVSFEKDGTVIGTADTNSSGLAQYTYSSAGVGDVEFVAKVRTFVSEIYEVEDCWKYDDTSNSIDTFWNTGGSITLDSNYGYDFPQSSANIRMKELLPNGYVISWEYNRKPNKTVPLRLAFMNNSGSVQKYLSYAFDGNPHYFGIITNVIALDTPSIMSVKVSSTGFEVYDDGVLINSGNTDLTGYYVGFASDSGVSQYVKNIKIKQL